MTNRQVLALCGPTASGKSAIAMQIADRLDAEIVCCDSMQVYRGFDVGTAKPSDQDRARVAHHCLDLVDPSQEFSAADYRGVARAAVADVHARGRTPLFVGGTGLYLRAALDDIRLGSPPDPDRRSALEDRSPEDLSAELEARAPDVAARTDLRNPRRVLRALERALDGDNSGPDPAWSERRARWPLALAVVAPADRTALRDRIDARVGAMLAGGWIAEVRDLDAQYAEWSRTAREAIGYRELRSVVRGEATLDEVVSLVKARTRRYARRQHTWFRREPRAVWFTGEAPDLAAAVGDWFGSRMAVTEPTSGYPTRER